MIEIGPVLAETIRHAVVALGIALVVYGFFR